MKPIYHAEQIISAYETAMGLPEAMRMTNDDGTFKAAATQQHIDKVCEKALAAAELPADWNGLVDRMRDCLLVKELAALSKQSPAALAAGRYKKFRMMGAGALRKERL